MRVCLPRTIYIVPLLNNPMLGLLPSSMSSLFSGWSVGEADASGMHHVNDSQSARGGQEPAQVCKNLEGWNAGSNDSRRRVTHPA